MDARSSALDHISLSRPDDDFALHAKSSSSTPAWQRNPAGVAEYGTSQPQSSRAKSAREGVGANEDKDLEMTFGEDVDLAGEKLHDGGIPTAFGGFAATALDRYAPLPEPDTPRVKRATPKGLRKDASRAAVLHRSGRTRGSEPPMLAVPLGKDKFADFRPWVGNSPEDILNESVIRTGFAEKTPTIGQSETNMARPAVWPSLKNKNGLPLLSMLLVQVMDKRQALGKCNTPSTFKPPPRVTLTDTKREAWLRDLASADVPLRRLSRTIPHGIRGKVLLDQCYSKNVPLARAIWLIKCVGANEIRAFRRKGISGAVAHSGELKWIKEWTLCVEQFVTAAIAGCGQKDWKNHIRFTVRLTAALFTEDLLDHEHFLDWLIAAFSTSQSEMLPMWFVLIQLFWSHITDVQRRGQLLTEAVIAQLATLKTHSMSAVLESLFSTLELYLQRLVRDHKACVVALKDWAKARPILHSVQNQSGDVHTKTSFDNVIWRNDRLDPSPGGLREAMRPPSLILFDYLDTLPASITPDLCAERCREICHDETELIGALLDWGSSIYRTGHARVYHAAVLLQRLACQGTVLDHGILNALFDTTKQRFRDQRLFAKIVAELVSTHYFNYGKYLQCLISSGVAWQPSSPPFSLLFDISTAGLNSQSVSLRKAILARLNMHTNNDGKVAVLREQLQDVLHETLHRNHDVEELLSQISNLDSSDSNAICRWLQETIESSLAECRAEKRHTNMTATIYSISRSVFENASEFRSLSGVLQSLIPVASPQLFAELAATVEQNARVLAAMGNLEPLSSQLVYAYAHFRQVNRLDQISILSMLSICRVQPAFGAHVKRLENDLLTLEQQHAAAVCSPASDSILTVQNGQINADEDIDRMLTSGNMMDEQMLARLFSAIVERTVKWTVSGSVSLSNPCRWFSQLRAFDNSTFDRHMNNLVSKLVVNAGTDQVRAILISLVASGCLKLDETLAAFEKRLDTLETTSAPQLARFAIGTLQTFLPLKDLDRQLRSLEIYRFRIAQKQACDQNRSTILRLVWHGLSAPAEVAGLLFSKATITWLSACCIEDSEAFQRWLHIRDSGTGHRIQQLTRLVRVISTGASVYEPDAVIHETSLDTDELVLGSTELRLPFLRLILLRMTSNAAQNEDQSSVGVLDSFKAAIQSSSLLWPQLIDSIGIDLALALRQNSCDAILQQVAAFLQAETKDFDEKCVTNHLKVIAITASQAKLDETSLIDQIADNLHALRERLAESASATATSQHGVTLFIVILVKLLITALPSVASDQIIPTPLQRIFGVLCLFMTEGMFQFANVEDLIFDCSTVLVRRFSSEALAALYKKMPDDTRQDPRVRSLLGVEASESRWLASASKVSVQPQNSAGSPTTAQGSFSRSLNPNASPSRAVAGGQQQSGWMPTSQPPSVQGASARSLGALAQDTKYTPFVLRRWELMQDPTPNTGENDTSLSLQLFAARKVY